MTQTSEIKQALKKKLLVMGWNSVERAIKSGKVKKVFISAKASQKVKKDLAHYSKVSSFEVEKFMGDADELGVICKKPFRISILAVKAS